jgi:hypothetical protein
VDHAHYRAYSYDYARLRELGRSKWIMTLRYMLSINLDLVDTGTTNSTGENEGWSSEPRRIQQQGIYSMVFIGFRYFPWSLYRHVQFSRLLDIIDPVFMISFNVY